jgi:5-methylcytosine-specific restriction enzyme B
MNYYIVRAIWDNTIDMSDKFLENNYWENGYSDKYLDEVNSINVNDIIVLAGKAKEVQGIGHCIKNERNGKTIKVKWEGNFSDKTIENLNTYQKTIQKVQKQETISKIEKLLTIKSLDEKGSQMNLTKNIMLYGAPGVGKTYNYKKLVSLIEGGDFSESDIFDFIINNKDDEIEEGSVERLFEIVTKEKRIEFVTFHQSYSYEDFIEGFRPDEDKNQIIRKDGTFKLIADQARKNLNESKKDIETIQGEKTFQEIFELYKDLIQDEIDKNQKFIINDTAYIINIEDDAFRYTGDQWGNTQRMKFHDIELLNELHITERKDIKKTDGLSGLAYQHATYFSYFMKKFHEFKQKQNIKIKKSEVEQIEQKNFYIVIDEINRGNISKIFGELITLIEEDKRDSYEVTLPYSKQKFKIPSNLYIIATMNSTDKSIATIDIALRRRFTFLKMQPNENLIDYQSAKKLFNELNDFIAENLNEDYKLGHSYFMKVTNDQELEFVKEYKIKPLLEEYFYVDPKKLAKALDLLEENTTNYSEE